MIRVQSHLIWECDGFISMDVSGYIGHNILDLFPWKNKNKTSATVQAQSKVILGRLVPICFHQLNRQKSAEIVRMQKFRILASLNLDNFLFFWIIELGKFQNSSKSHHDQCLQEHFNHHTSSSETNASCSCTTTIPCPCRNNIMVCIYSSFFLFETILTCLEITCLYAPGW